MAPREIHNTEALLLKARQTAFRARLLSKELRISSRQLCRYTHKLFGCSPQDWLDQQRLRLAAGLLREYRCVKTVAFSLGFKRISHFSREFKLHYGLPPTAYIDWMDRQSHAREHGNGQSSVARVPTPIASYTSLLLDIPNSVRAG